MQRMFAILLAAVSLGPLAIAAVPGIALADGGRQYRVLGCDLLDDPSVPPPPPGSNAAFVVVSSLSPEEFGQPCETVLSSLGDQGFRLIEVRVRSEFFGAGMPSVGVLHYLERSEDED